MITYKTPEEIEIMAEAGSKLASVLKALVLEVCVGTTTEEIDKKAFELIKAAGAKPAFLGYRPGGALKAYPKTICVSINEVVVHGLPSPKKIIQDGDVVKLDLGLIWKGFYSDSAVTVPVGRVSKQAEELIRVTREALSLAIKMAKPGNTTGDIGHAVQKFVESHGFEVVKYLGGHGIGKELHEDPFVMNFGNPGDGELLESGMVIAIEPMVAVGSGRVKQTKDDEFVTLDKSISAQFEHTVAIMPQGARVLTKL